MLLVTLVMLSLASLFMAASSSGTSKKIASGAGETPL